MKQKTWIFLIFEGLLFDEIKNSGHKLYKQCRKTLQTTFF